jgi:hypothetical protein
MKMLKNLSAAIWLFLSECIKNYSLQFGYSYEKIIACNLAILMREMRKLLPAIRLFFYKYIDIYIKKKHRDFREFKPNYI